MATKPDVQTKGITEEEYSALGSDVHAEVIDGKLRILPPNIALHGLISGTVGFLLLAFADARRTGRVFSMTSFILRENPDRTLRDTLVPDVSYVSYKRLSEDADLNMFPRFAPDLAAEVISSSDTTHIMMTKIKLYLEYGVEQVWLVFPDDHEIRVCTPTHPLGQTFGMEDTLTGGDVLPGFSVPMRAIFDEHDQELFVETLQALLKTE